MIIGRSISFIDSKSRLYISNQIIKSYFRTAGKMVLTFGLDSTCLYLMDEPSLEGICERFKSLPFESSKAKDYRLFMRFLASNSVERKIDAKNRIIIPSEFLEYAGIKDKVYLVGAGSYMEIWDYKCFVEYEKKNRQKFVKIATKIII